MAFGDSITVGYGVPVGSGYVQLLGEVLGIQIDDVAISGSMAGDQAPLIFNTVPASGDLYIIMLGANDQAYWGAGQDSLKYYRAIIEDMAAYLATPAKCLARASCMTYSGSWGPSAFISQGSNVAGSAVEFQFAGTTLYIDTIWYDVATGTADVYVDGAKVGSLTSAAPGIATKNGNHYMPALVRFGSLPAGAHAGKIVTTNGGGTNYTFINWIGGNAQPASPLPRVYVSGPTRFSTTGYASAGGSDANVAVYDAAAAALVNELSADGLAVFLVNGAMAVDPANQLLPDGEHPNVSGHMSLEAIFAAAIGGIVPPVTYTQTYLWRGSDGSYCVAPSMPSASCSSPLTVP